jgi:hypothetical protein
MSFADYKKWTLEKVDKVWKNKNYY